MRDEARPGSCGHPDGADEHGVALGDTINEGLEGHAGNVREGDKPGRIGADEAGSTSEASGPCNGFWRNAFWIPCRDGKARPLERAAESVLEPLADGVAGDLGLVRLESYPGRPHEERIAFSPLIQKGKARVGRLRGYGNCIVAPQAIEFITAVQSYMKGES
jgi:DNA (cytosine-5)-methyltransferase 1